MTEEKARTNHTHILTRFKLFVLHSSKKKVHIVFNMKFKLFNTNALQQLSKKVKLSDSGPGGSGDCMMFVTLPQAKSVFCKELHFLLLYNTRATSSETEGHRLGFMSPLGSPCQPLFFFSNNILII